MIIRVVHDKDNPYFLMRRTVVEDDRLSFKAVGILTYLLSKPDNWTVREEDLIQRHSDGATSVRSGLRELRDCRYLIRKTIRGAGGKLAGTEIIVHEIPNDEPDDLIIPPQHRESSNSSGNDRDVGNPRLGFSEFRETNPLVSKENVVSKEEESPQNGDGVCAYSSSSGNGFHIPGEEIAPKEKSYFRQSAELLMRKLDEKRRLYRDPNPSKWAETIRLFMIESSIDRKHFSRVLEWYVENIERSNWVPDAFSASAFCEKFERIEAAMRRSGEDEPEEQWTPPVVKRVAQLTRPYNPDVD